MQSTSMHSPSLKTRAFQNRMSMSANAARLFSKAAFSKCAWTFFCAPCPNLHVTGIMCFSQQNEAKSSGEPSARPFKTLGSFSKRSRNENSRKNLCNISALLCFQHLAQVALSRCARCRLQLWDDGSASWTCLRQGLMGSYTHYANTCVVVKVGGQNIKLQTADMYVVKPLENNILFAS